MPDFLDLNPPLGAFDSAQRPAIADIGRRVRMHERARRFWFSAHDASTNGTRSGFGGPAGDRPYVSLADAAAQGCGWWDTLPYESFGRPVKLLLFWTQDGTAAGAFWVDIAIQVRVSGDVLTAASGWIFAAGAITVPGVANQMVITEYNPTATIPTPVADQDTAMSVRVRRVGTNGADTCTDAMRFVALQLTVL